jgi:hypothetical protein
MIGKKAVKELMTIIVLSVFLFNSSITLFAADEKVTLQVDDTSIEIGSSLQLTLSIFGGLEVQDIGIEGLENFEVVSTSQSSSTQMVNGVSSSKVEYHVELMPKSIGAFTLKAIINQDKDKIESNQVEVTVKEQNTSLENESEDVFIKASLSKENSYFGEKVLLSYELYTRYNVEDYGFTDEFTMNGLIALELPEEQLQSNFVTINGNKYLRYDVKKLLLTPTSTGMIIIPSFNFQVNISTGDFFSSSKPMYLKTEELNLMVDSVPTAGKPTDFSGLVGTMDLKASYDKKEIEYGEAVTLSVLLTGSVDLDIVDNLYDDNQKDVTLYETQKDVSLSTVDGQYVYSKEYEIIIVPKEVGDITLNAVKLNYFNTETNAYEYLEIPSEVIHINGSINGDSQKNQGTQVDTANAENGATPILISQVSYNDTQKDELVIRINKKSALLVIASIIGLIGLLLFIRKIRDERLKDEFLRTLKKKLKKSHTEVEIFNILNEYVDYKCKMNIKSHTQKDILQVFDQEKNYNGMSDLLKYFGHDKYYKQENVKELKERMAIVLNQSM